MLSDYVEIVNLQVVELSALHAEEILIELALEPLQLAQEVVPVLVFGQRQAGQVAWLVFLEPAKNITDI